MIFLFDVNAIERCIVMKNTWYPCNEQTEGNESLLRGNSNQPPTTRKQSIPSSCNLTQYFVITPLHTTKEVFGVCFLLLYFPFSKEESNVWWRNDITLSNEHLRTTFDKRVAVWLFADIFAPSQPITITSLKLKIT